MAITFYAVRFLYIVFWWYFWAHKSKLNVFFFFFFAVLISLSIVQSANLFARLLKKEEQSTACFGTIGLVFNLCSTHLCRGKEGNMQIIYVNIPSFLIPQTFLFLFVCSCLNSHFYLLLSALSVLVNISLLWYYWEMTLGAAWYQTAPNVLTKSPDITVCVFLSSCQEMNYFNRNPHLLLTSSFLHEWTSLLDLMWTQAQNVTERTLSILLSLDCCHYWADDGKLFFCSSVSPPTVSPPPSHLMQVAIAAYATQAESPCHLLPTCG